jgi:hypothetical protein
MDDPPTAPPRHPFVWATINGREHPGIVIEWAKIADANGYRSWYCRVAYVLDGQSATTLLPGTQVRRG